MHRSSTKPAKAAVAHRARRLRAPGKPGQLVCEDTLNQSQPAFAQPNPPVFEPFVDEEIVAQFLKIESRRVLQMARNHEIPAHPIGKIRRTWRFRLSEIDAHFSAPSTKHAGARFGLAVPGTQERQ
jgi:Helix-turn-helix domain